MCMLALGRPEDALACLSASEALLEDGSSLEVRVLQTELLGGLCLAHLRQSARLRSTHELAARQHMEKSLQIARDLAELTGGGRPNNYSELPAYAHPAEVFLTLWEDRYPEEDLPDWAGKACRSLQGYAKVFPIGRPRALLLHGRCAWLSGKPQRARAAWAQSLAAAQELDMPYDEALAHFEIGHRAEVDDPARLQHLGQATAIFGKLGVDAVT